LIKIAVLQTQNQLKPSMLSQFRKQKVARIFEFYDVNENGQIEFDDIIDICNAFANEFEWEPHSFDDDNFRTTFKNLWLQLLKNADQNADNQVSLKEFLDSYEVAIADDASFQIYIQPFFDMIYPILDEHNIGYIKKEYYMRFYKAFRNSEKAAAKAFVAMDLNEDGLLSKQEFYQNFYNFHMSEDRQDRSLVFFGNVELPTLT